MACLHQATLETNGITTPGVSAFDGLVNRVSKITAEVDRDQDRDS
ncbi:hypothetical protein SynA1825c_01316 [Synechococcus sp. A18-25c]|nr:hypothetical protein SynA1825c_01316 [Synechococcus sp. A18-25c]